MSSQPNLKQLKHFMRDDTTGVINKWYDLGLELLDSNTSLLDAIKDNNQNDADKCCTNMFKEWLARTPDASWDQLSTSLNHIGMNTAAKSIPDLHKEAQPIMKQVSVTESVRMCDSSQVVLTKSFPRLISDPSKAISEFISVVSLIEDTLSRANEAHNLKAIKSVCGYLPISSNSKRPMFSNEQLIEIDACGSIQEIFRKLRFYLRWDDHLVLNVILDRIDSVECEELLIQYETKIDCQMKLEHIFQQCKEHNYEIPKTFSHMVVIVNKKYSRITKGEYDQLKSFIAKQCGVEPYVLSPFVNMSKSSLILEWLVPPTAVTHMVEMAKKSNFISNDVSVLFLKIADYRIIDKSEKSQPQSKSRSIIQDSTKEGHKVKQRSKHISDKAADNALKQISSMETLEQLDLFETVLHLYRTEGGLTSLEYQQLQDVHTVELHRKSLLLTSIIPGKGLYRGMRMLRRALKRTGQRPIKNKLDKAYKDAVDELIAKNLRIRQGPWSNETAGADQSSQMIPRVDSVATASSSSFYHASITSEHPSLNKYRDGIQEDSCDNTATRERTPSGNMSRRSITTSSSDDDDGVLLDTTVQEQQQPTSLCIPSLEVNIQFHMSEDLSGDHIPSVQLTPYRQRSGHISHRSNPYTYKVPERAKSSASSALVNETFEEEQLLSQMSTEKSMREDNNKVGTLTSLHSINQLECESLVLKFVIVGDSSTGKTSLLYRYVSGKFSIVYDPTTLVDFQSAELECYNKKYKLHLWDTAGQERFKAVTTAYYRDAVGAFVVYDVTDMRSLEHSSQWKKEIDDVVRLVNGDPIPVVLIANKMDCGHLDGEQFSKDHGFVGYFETSAKTGQGIQAAVHFLVKKVHALSCVHKEPVVQTLYRNRSTSIMLHFNNDSKEKKCCKN